MNIGIAILLLAQLGEVPAAATEGAWSTVSLRKVSEVELPASALEGKWKIDAGLKIDDFAKLEGMPKGQRQAAEALRPQLTAVGVQSTAEYTLVKTAFPLNTVTVRVFIFETPEKCRAWWEKKYQYENWEKHYKQFDCDLAVAVSSVETNKTAMAFGNVWLTTHELGKGNAHILAANHVLKQLTHEKRSLPSQ